MWHRLGGELRKQTYDFLKWHRKRSSETLKRGFRRPFAWKPD
jgi:hypothetical protein